MTSKVQQPKRVKNVIITSRQHQVLTCLDKLNTQYGRNPTGQEIAKKLKVTRQAVQLVMSQLVAKGYVDQGVEIVIGPWSVSRKGREWL